MAFAHFASGLSAGDYQFIDPLKHVGKFVIL